MNRRELFSDLLLFIGVAGVITGVACFSWRAGVIVGGVLVAAVGVVLAIGGPGKPDEGPERWRPARARQAPSVMDDPLPPRSPLGDSATPTTQERLYRLPTSAAGDHLFQQVGEKL